MNVKKTETEFIFSVRKMPDHEIVFFEFLDVATDVSFYMQVFPWKLFSFLCSFTIVYIFCVYVLITQTDIYSTPQWIRHIGNLW